MYKERLKQFDFILNETRINIPELKKLCFNGCPDEKSIRATCWKLLLGYLPEETSEWESHLKKQRTAYAKFVEEIVINSKQDDKDSTNELNDHPLNPNPQSCWNRFFEDNQMLCQIDRDCRRLSPGLAFYQWETKYPFCKLFNLSATDSLTPLRKRVEQGSLKADNFDRNLVGNFQKKQKKNNRNSNSENHLSDEGSEYHWEVVERILFIYSKLNPGQGYVQGMNEVIGPIYYTFAMDQNDQENAEADTFWCFMKLMAEVRDNFIKSLDLSQEGIHFKMQCVMNLLEKYDTPLSIRLKDLDILPQFYCFRWITVLLTQEFDLPNVVRIWDSLLSHKLRFDFLIYISCAMIVLVRDDIFSNDFTMALKTLQNYPDNKIITDILVKAVEIYQQ